VGYPFCVDNSSQPEYATATLHELRRTIRYGKIAQHALRQLQTVGHYDGRVPCTHQRSGYNSAKVDVHKFPKLEAIHRGLIPGYQDFQIRLSEKKSSYYHKRAEFDVIFDGLYTCWDAETQQSVVKHTGDEGGYGGEFGKVRVCTNHISFIASNVRQEHVKIFHNCNLPGADDQMILFARAVATMVFVDIRWKTDYPQQIVDLHKNLPRWLVEDGFCRRWFREIRDHVAVASVMET
jgi:hypothetical protein